MVGRPPIPGSLSRRLRSVFAGLVGHTPTDGDLLTRFVSTHDEQAFAELVRRLGPAVFGVCRRFLGPTPDAEDAFQSVFLVLARKAGTVRPPGKVAAWLHGVAALTARKARAVRGRRLARETTTATPPERPAPEVPMCPDLAPVLDEELNRLPDKFRLPVVLCELRDLTAAEAAAELGWPVGTVSSRLSRGRGLLRERLARRGVTAAAVAVGLTRPATASVPERLIESTVSAAVAGGVPPSAAVLSLTREVLRAMNPSKLRLMAGGLLAAVAVVAFGGGAFTPTSTAAPVPAPGKEKEFDPVDRVKLPDLGPLLRVEAVQKAVGLSEADAKALTDAWLDGVKDVAAKSQALIQAEINRQVQAQGGAGRVINLTNPTGVIDKLHQERIDEFNKKAVGMMKPEQVRQLKQFVLQLDGASALLDRRVIRALGLTADQEDKIDAALPPRRKGVITKEDYAKVGEETDAALKEAAKVLTPEQQKRWEGIIGKRLPSEDLLRAHPLSVEAMNATAAGGVVNVRGAAWAPALPAVPVVPPAGPGKE